MHVLYVCLKTATCIRLLGGKVWLFLVKTGWQPWT